MTVKISSRAKALLSFLSQFSEPFDLQEALNCPANIEMGHPSTWDHSIDKWGIFRELFYANLLVLITNENVLKGGVSQSEKETVPNQRYLYTVTEKGRQTLLPQPLIGKIFKQLFSSATTIRNSQEPVFTQALTN